MAENLDGGIVLNVTINGSEVSGDMKKIVADISKAVQQESKNLQAVEKLNQEKAKTVKLNEEAKQHVINTAKAENNYKISVEGVKQAVDETAISHEKVEQSLSSTGIKAEKLTQEYAKSAEKMEEVSSIEGATEQIQNKRIEHEERLADVTVGVAEHYENVKQNISDTIANADELTKSTLDLARAANETAISDERVKQAIDTTAISAEELKQSVMETGITTERLNQAQIRTNILKEGEYQAEEKTAQAKETSLQKTFQTAIYQQKLGHEIEKGYQAEEKTAQAEEKTLHFKQQTLINNEEINQSKLQTQILQEKYRQSVIATQKAEQSLHTATTQVLGVVRKLAAQLGIYFSIRQVLTFSSEAAELASDTEAYLTRMGMLFGKYGQDIYDFAEDNAFALGMAKTAAYEAAASYGNLLRVSMGMEDSANLTMQLMSATAVIASQTGRTYDETFEKIQSGIYGNTRSIDDLGISIRQARLETTEAFETVTKGEKAYDDLTDAELQQLRVLGILEQTQMIYGNDVLQTTSLVRSQFNSAWNDFKATWGQMINGVLIPVLKYLTKIINVLNVAVSFIVKFMGITSNASTMLSNMSADGLSDGLEDATEAQKEYNKELKKTLADFDEISILKSGDDNETADEDTGKSQNVGDKTTSDSASKVDPNVESWKAAILGLAELLVGAALVALGIILCASGAFALGIGSIAAGLLMIGIAAVTLDNAFNLSDAKEMLLFIGKIGALVLICLGAVLITLGAVPWGIAAIAGGLTLLGLTVYEASKIDISEAKRILKDLMDIAAGALIAIGVFLIWLGIYGWGITAIIGGLLIKGYGETTLGEFDIHSLQDWCDEIMKIIAGALIGIGVILIKVGSVGWGIGCIIAGLLISTIEEVNSNESISGELKTWVNAIASILAGIALSLGIILLCFGIVNPLTIGLVIVGAAVLAEEVSLHWGYIEEYLKGWVGVIVAVLSAALLVLGVIICITGVGLPLGIALIVAGAAGLVGIVALNWNAIKEKVVSIFKAVLKWIKTYGLLVLSIILIVSGISIPLGAYMLFMWCKDNYGSNPLATSIVDTVKNVWESIKTFWQEHVSKYFKVAFWKDMFVKIGNGIIGVVEDILNFLTKGIRDLWDGVAWLVEGAADIIGWDVEIGSIPEITLPRLAKGGVIPANNEFLAILGDQKHGTNIEAPAELIKQMVNEALDERGVTGGTQQTVKEEHYYLNKNELMSVVYKLAQGGERISGNKLITSGGF